MGEQAWFDDFGEGLDDVQRAFLGELRARAVSWPVEPDDTNLALPGWETYGPSGPDDFGRLLVWMDVIGEGTALLTVGAYLDGNRVRGDKVHNQLLTLPEKPTSLAMDVTGSPAELAARTADWFEGLLRRPIVREEWLADGEVCAHRWSFADTGLPLVEGRARTASLGKPDRVTLVRGD